MITFSLLEAFCSRNKGVERERFEHVSKRKEQRRFTGTSRRRFLGLF